MSGGKTPFIEDLAGLKKKWYKKKFSQGEKVFKQAFEEHVEVVDMTHLVREQLPSRVEAKKYPEEQKA